MPIFFNIGIAISDLHVVGLQDPPRNTSQGGGVASLPFTCLQIVSLSLNSLSTFHCGDSGLFEVCLACLEHRRSSAANTQNSPKVRTSDLRRAHCRAHTSISNTCVLVGYSSMSLKRLCIRSGEAGWSGGPTRHSHALATSLIT